MTNLEESKQRTSAAVETPRNVNVWRAESSCLLDIFHATTGAPAEV
jgi:hypothetical protein